MHDTSDWPKLPAFDRASEKLRAIALSYPESYEDHPWGESAFKVKGKVFLFLGRDRDTFGTSTKLPVSATLALMLPFAEPTGYGLGKSGWVSARFGRDDDVPYDILTAWIDESYRAVAPAKLVATLPPAGSGPAAAQKPASPKKATASKKPASANKPPAAKKPASANKPPAAKKPASANKPPVAKKPARANKPPVAKKPADKRPAVAKKPAPRKPAPSK